MTAKLQEIDRLQAMKTGGLVLGQIKKQLRDLCQPGVRFEEVEALAQELIKNASMRPSFSTVEGYKWATCVMKNHELCHGIPRKKIVEVGDIITIDVGLINQGYHLDTTISFAVGKVSRKLQNFLNVGQMALDRAIEQAIPGNTVYQVSRAMQHAVERAGYGAVYQLTGHGIGRELHMEPGVPCAANRSDKKEYLYEDQTLAIEIMYTMGRPDLKLAADGWTYETIDGSIAAMFEETVVVKPNSPQVLTLS